MATDSTLPDHNHSLIADLSAALWPSPGTREWIKRGGHSFGADPFTVLHQQTVELTDDIEIEIRVVRWNFPKDRVQTVKAEA